MCFFFFGAGGGHSDIFGAPEQKPTHARPKYDQQNSSNVCGALGTTDANEVAEKTAREIQAKQADAKATNNVVSSANGDANNGGGQAADQSSQSRRVPPGGYSQGFW